MELARPTSNWLKVRAKGAKREQPIRAPAATALAVIKGRRRGRRRADKSLRNSVIYLVGYYANVIFNDKTRKFHLIFPSYSNFR